MQTSHPEYVNEVKASKIYTLNQNHSFSFRPRKKIIIITLSLLSLLFVGYKLKSNNSNSIPIQLAQNPTHKSIEIKKNIAENTDKGIIVEKIETPKKDLSVTPHYTTAKRPSTLVTTVSYIPTSTLEERFIRELKAIK